MLIQTDAPQTTTRAEAHRFEIPPLKSVAWSLATRRNVVIEHPLSAQLRGVIRGQDATALEAPLTHFLNSFGASEDAIDDVVSHPSIVDALASSQELTRLIVAGAVHVEDLLALLNRWPNGMDDVRGRDEALFDLYRSTWSRMDTSTDADRAGLIDQARSLLSTVPKPYFAARGIHQLIADPPADNQRFRQQLGRIVPLPLDPRFTALVARESALMTSLDGIVAKGRDGAAMESMLGRQPSEERMTRAIQLLDEPRFLTDALRNPRDAAMNYTMLMSAAYDDRSVARVIGTPYAGRNISLDACFVEQALRTAEAQRYSKWPGIFDTTPAVRADRVANLVDMAPRNRLNVLTRPGSLEQIAQGCCIEGETARASGLLALAFAELRDALPDAASAHNGDVTVTDVLDVVLPHPDGTSMSTTDWLCKAIELPENQPAVAAYVSLFCHIVDVTPGPLGHYIVEQFQKPSMQWFPDADVEPLSIEECFNESRICGDVAFAELCRAELREAGLLR